MRVTVPISHTRQAQASNTTQRSAAHSVRSVNITKNTKINPLRYDWGDNIENAIGELNNIAKEGLGAFEYRTDKLERAYRTV